MSIPGPISDERFNKQFLFKLARNSELLIAKAFEDTPGKLNFMEILRPLLFLKSPALIPLLPVETVCCP